MFDPIRWTKDVLLPILKKGGNFIGWLYGEQVKENKMWGTSSLPSQHDKASLLYPIFLKIQAEVGIFKLSFRYAHLTR
jgi:hypothetical protein